MDSSAIQRKRILENAIPGIVIRMAIPSIVIQIITLIYNTVDTYYISQIGKSAAAAVGTVFSLQSVIQAVGFGFGMGVSSLCSRKLGEAADDQANCYASSGLAGAVILACLLGVLGSIFLSPVLRLVGCTETMLPYAGPYAQVVFACAPVACGGFVFANIFKAEGHIRYSMYGNIVGAAANVILDPLLIFDMGLGTAGAAIATSVSQLLSLLIYIILMRMGKTVIRVRYDCISKNLETYVQIITTGIPTVFRQGLGSAATILLCRQAGLYGDAAVAAVTISNKCYMLIRNIILGIGQGTQPVAGYNYGAGQYRRTKEAFDFAMKLGTVLCLIASVILYMMAGELMWWFCQDEAVLEVGIHALRYASLVVPVMACSTYVNQEYQSLGFKKQATLLASCRQGICFIPTILLLPVLLGVTGVALAQPLADLLTFFISIPFYIKMSSLLIKKQQLQDKSKTDVTVQ